MGGAETSEVNPRSDIPQGVGVGGVGESKATLSSFQGNRIPPVIKYQYDTKKEHREIRFN